MAHEAEHVAHDVEHKEEHDVHEAVKDVEKAAEATKVVVPCKTDSDCKDVSFGRHECCDNLANMQPICEITCDLGRNHQANEAVEKGIKKFMYHSGAGVSGDIARMAETALGVEKITHARFANTGTYVKGGRRFQGQQ